MSHLCVRRLRQRTPQAEIGTERAALLSDCNELSGQQDQLTREIASLNRDEMRIKTECVLSHAVPARRRG